MPAGDSDKGRDRDAFKDSLRRQGVSADEMQKVYRTLRGRGYGEEEARKRSTEALERMRQLRSLQDRRHGMQAGQRHAGDRGHGPTAERLAAAGRRAVDKLPVVPPWLRRQINRYAYSNGFLITRFAQLVDDFLSVFDAARPDFVSRALLAALAEEKGFYGRPSTELSFIDTLDALKESSDRLLGERGAWAPSRKSDEVLATIRAREPFAVEFLSVFTEPHEGLRRGLEYLGTALRMHRKVPVSELARVVKDGCRLIATTEALEPERLVLLLDLARDVNMEITPGAKAAGELLEAESLFRGAFQNLSRFGHELYPALLKMIAAFYPEEDVSPQKRTIIQRFLGITDADLLTWAGWQRRLQELRDQAVKEQQAREVAQLEHEKTEGFSVRFEGILSLLASLFPGSGIERLEQGEFFLPYFTHRVFPFSTLFLARAVDLESLSAQDVMGRVLVLHSIVDDLLSSVNAARLEKILGREGFAADFVGLRDQWRDMYPRVFEPYLDAIREFARETSGDPRYAELFRESQRARTIRDRVEQLRGAAVNAFRRPGSGRFDGTRVYEVTSRLSDLLEEAGLVINQPALAASDTMQRKLLEDLARTGFVDFIACSRPGTLDYHPVTRQVRRWAEARYHEDILDIPDKAQVAFLDVLRGVLFLYHHYLEDERSPAAAASHSIEISTSAEHAAWNKERAVGPRDARKSLLSTLGEQFPGRFLDALTGLRNKDYFLNELPQGMDELRSRGTPITLLMIDLDHFKWINDSLGHSRGDEVLKTTAAMILDNVREGDIAVRYGGEEILVVAPSDAHTALLLAERLRFAQEARVLSRDGMQDVRKAGLDHGEPCGTLSIGVCDITSVTDLARAVEKADKGLYAAKKMRNVVVLAEADRLTTYSEYRARTTPAAAPAPPAPGHAG
ncbi:MAG TPA: GGDEF domain-containing protein [Spirochaetia bacterium]|nr:GGDEF domain-containing protein [Spirochaetia bacterium]